ncbi:MAG TPA: dipeptide/oligopeptide/nickel ABC transporter permease/ATP-binding protein, partial [Trebonia sp.]|nr:dipeptide/oligopeptide/nickel ABC transporter permease/ATP-binding protein [Trebonia sp.]
LLSAILFLAVFGPLLAPYAPNDTAGPQLTGPSAQFLLGTDYIGRDVLSRLLVGAGLSVLGALLVAMIALVFGALPGVLSVYLGRVFEWVTLRIIDTLIALPFLVFAVAMTALLGNGVFQALFAVGFLLAPVFYRVARSATLAVANSQYVEAAILAGASTWWIVRKHVWNKVAPPVAISLSTTIGLGLVVIASLTFLSIGVSPPQATWGGVLATDLAYIAVQSWAPVVPVALILVAVLACNLFADAVRDTSGEAGRQLLNAQAAKEAARGKGRTLVTPVPEAKPSEEKTKIKAIQNGSLVPVAAPTEQVSAVAPRAGQPEVVLDVDDLKIFGAVDDSELIKGVSFSLPRGKTLGVVGESGSGKTLSVRAVLGIVPKQLTQAGGTVEILGRDSADFTKQDWVDIRGNSISAVFQDPGSYLNPSIWLGKQVAEVLRVKKKLSRAAAKAETLRLFKAVHLREPHLVYEQYVHELSGGMLQRVLIATAIALSPDILIADEATTALDVTVQSEILDLLQELQETQGLSLVVISHDLAVVAQLSNDVLVMRAGTVIEHGPASQVLHNPQHSYTQLLVSEHERFGIDRYINSGLREASLA